MWSIERIVSIGVVSSWRYFSMFVMRGVILICFIGWFFLIMRRVWFVFVLGLVFVFILEIFLVLSVGGFFLVIIGRFFLNFFGLRLFVIKWCVVLRWSFRELVFVIYWVILFNIVFIWGIFWIIIWCIFLGRMFRKVSYLLWIE